MTRWRIEPGRVQSVLSDVGTGVDDLAAAVTDSAVQSVLDGLTWGAPVTDDVARTVSGMLAVQVEGLAGMVERVQASGWGVARATAAYVDGQDEMAAAVQRELLDSMGGTGRTDGWHDPYTGNGFLKSDALVPEYRVEQNPDKPYRYAEGSELWEVLQDGTQRLACVFRSIRWVRVVA